jgi:hypothetical protein
MSAFGSGAEPYALRVYSRLEWAIDGYAVLPTWAVLRIVDFMFDGPRRRSRKPQ